MPMKVVVGHYIGVAMYYFTYEDVLAGRKANNGSAFIVLLGKIRDTQI